MSLGFYDEHEPGLLPHPEIPLPVLLVVESALCAAWDLVRAHPREGFDLLTAEEDSITLELYEALFDRVFKSGVVEGFDANLFSTVEREPKVRNHNYDHPDKMPDLLVRLIGRPDDIRNSQDGLFIECKPVDSDHAVRGHYCNKGLIRFVVGDYAWAMANAMMVGYTRRGYTVPAKLIPALQDWPDRTSACMAPRPCSRSKATSISEAVFLTDHPRTFSYPQTARAAPGIRVRHLWLKRD
jgi:hypothetical protein